MSTWSFLIYAIAAVLAINGLLSLMIQRRWQTAHALITAEQTRRQAAATQAKAEAEAIANATPKEEPRAAARV